MDQLGRVTTNHSSLDLSSVTKADVAFLNADLMKPAVSSSAIFGDMAVTAVAVTCCAPGFAGDLQSFGCQR